MDFPKCNHTSFLREKGGYYHICNNGLCLLTDDELKELKKNV